MTELDMVISAAEATLSDGMAFAYGSPNPQGAKIHPDHFHAQMMAVGMFQCFVANLHALRDKPPPQEESILPGHYAPSAAVLDLVESTIAGMMGPLRQVKATEIESPHRQLGADAPVVGFGQM